MSKNNQYKGKQYREEDYEEEVDGSKKAIKTFVIIIIVIISLILLYCWALRPLVKFGLLNDADNFSMETTVAAASVVTTTNMVVDSNKVSIQVDDESPIYVEYNEAEEEYYIFSSIYYNGGKYYKSTQKNFSTTIDLSSEDIDPIFEASSWKWSFSEMSYTLKEDVISPLVIDLVGTSSNTVVTMDFKSTSITFNITSSDKDMNKVQIILKIYDIDSSEIEFDFEEGKPL